jgi:hypothetical protein
LIRQQFLLPTRAAYVSEDEDPKDKRPRDAFRNCRSAPDLGFGIPKFFLPMRLKWVIEIPL